MGGHFILLALAALACAQGVRAGPYIWRPRPVAKPLVAAAQWEIHSRLLSVEKQVLQTSLGLSRLAESVTGRAYRLTYEAEGRLQSLRNSLEQEVRTLRPLAPGCADPKTLQKAYDYIDNVMETMYQCTHNLSDVGATFEVALTEVLINARAQLWNVQEAMWFCERFRPQVDTECLKRLVDEGLEVSSLLPGRGWAVRDRAEARGAQALDLLSECLARGTSAAEEKALSTTQELRLCALLQDQQDSDNDGDDNVEPVQ